jgi:hypothetical protein
MSDDLLIPILVAILAGHAGAQRPANPLHGQNPARQHEDETACSQWAKSRSGYDPAHPTAAVPISSEPGGAARRRNRQAADAEDAATTLHAAGMQGSYYRARKTCLDGRGYNVN